MPTQAMRTALIEADQSVLPASGPMKIRIIKRNVEVDEALRRQVERRLGLAFGRFVSRIGCIVVRFSDINGHRGGVDKRCQIEVDLLPARAVRAEDTAAGLFAAVARAANRAARSVARTIAQEHGFATPRDSRGRPSFADIGTKTGDRPRGRRT
jgi:putative sigma-54 modulation protein